LFHVGHEVKAESPLRNERVSELLVIVGLPSVGRGRGPRCGLRKGPRMAVVEVNVARYPLQDLTNVTVEQRNKSKTAFIILVNTHSLTSLFPALNLTRSWNFLRALAVWSSRRRKGADHDCYN
jgi:hypothetical protein